MDTTDKYIEMCRQLPEEMNSDVIDGDFYYWKLASQEEGRICISYTEIFEDYIVHHPEQWDYLNDREIIKLYRQDQLQDMLYDTLEGLPLDPLWFIHSCYKTMDTVAYTYHNDKQKWDTMEKLWLSLVMYEKYNKIWNGSEWIVV